MNKKVVYLIILTLFIIIILASVLWNGELEKITNFEECAAAGNPVMESYPRQCRDAEGNLFVEVIRKQYVGYGVEECLTISILCTSGREYFSDETGCGCELKEESLEGRVNCTDESRNVDACIEIYQPVCGRPINQTFSNSCFACIDENVAYYTGGECP